MLTQLKVYKKKNIMGNKVLQTEEKILINVLSVPAVLEMKHVILWSIDVLCIVWTRYHLQVTIVLQQHI